MSRSCSASSDSSAACDEINQDKIIDQYIIDFRSAVLSATDILRSSQATDSSSSGGATAFGNDYSLEKDFVSSLMELNIIPKLKQVIV